MSHLQHQVLFLLLVMQQTAIYCLFQIENGENCMQENQRIVLTKRLLKEGLLRLIEKKDIDKISVSELCVESGINRATFYRHYQIPLDVLDDIRADFIKEMNFTPREPKNLQDIASQFENICNYLKKNENVTKILFSCGSDKDFSEVMNLYCKTLVNSEYESMLDTDSIRLIIQGLTSGGYAVIRMWILEDIQKTPKEMAEMILRFISYGSKLF